MRIFNEFNSLGVTILIASHDLNLVNRFSRRTLQLEHGKLIKVVTEHAV